MRALPSHSRRFSAEKRTKDFIASKACANRHRLFHIYLYIYIHLYSGFSRSSFKISSTVVKAIAVTVSAPP